jgi:CRISPR-associated protein Cas1
MNALGCSFYDRWHEEDLMTGACKEKGEAMSVLYLKEQGTSVQKSGERIVVKKSGQVLLDIPVFNVDNIAVIGNIQITTQALHMLMQNGVDVSYFTRSGKYIGATAAESAKNIFLRFEQYKCFMDESRRMDIARTIVDGKIRNQMEMIS